MKLNIHDLSGMFPVNSCCNGSSCMNTNSKLQIYKGMIEYLLDSTTYPLQRIANLSNSSFHNLQAIYVDNRLPPDPKTELNLLKLFSTVIDMELKGQWKAHRQLRK